MIDEVPDPVEAAKKQGEAGDEDIKEDINADGGKDPANADQDHMADYID